MRVNYTTLNLYPFLQNTTSNSASERTEPGPLETSSMQTNDNRPLPVRLKDCLIGYMNKKEEVLPKHAGSMR